MIQDLFTTLTDALEGAGAIAVAAATCTNMVQRYVNWNEESKGAVILRRVCGVLVLTGGLYLIFIAA